MKTISRTSVGWIDGFLGDVRITLPEIGATPRPFGLMGRPLVARGVTRCTDKHQTQRWAGDQWSPLRIYQIPLPKKFFKKVVKTVDKLFLKEYTILAVSLG